MNIVEITVKAEVLEDYVPEILAAVVAGDLSVLHGYGWTSVSATVTEKDGGYVR